MLYVSVGGDYMKINWKVRLRSKKFWVALLAFISLVLSRFEVIDVAELQVLLDSFLLVLIAAGVIVDPTTSGVNDSRRAMTYEKPRKDTW